MTRPDDYKGASGHKVPDNSHTPYTSDSTVAPALPKQLKEASEGRGRLQAAEEMGWPLWKPGLI